MNRYDASSLDKRNLSAVLEWQSSTRPEAAWLMADDRRITFGEAQRLVNRYARGLQARGIGRGQVLTMVMEPSPEVVLLALAAVRIGAVFTTICTDFKGAFLDEAIAMADPGVLVIDAAFAPRLHETPVRQRIRHLFVHAGRQTAGGEVAGLGAQPLAELLDACADAPDGAGESHWSDIVQVWWSSGTTGKPKGIMHTHSSLIFQACNAMGPRLRDGDVLYSCTPMYLGSSWTGTVWPSLLHGLPAAIDARFSVSGFWDRIRHYQATHCFTLGAMHMLLWKAEVRPDDRDNPLRDAFMIPTPHDLIPRFKERWGIERMDQGYGTSETFNVFVAQQGARTWEANALGVPVAWYEIRLLDEDDREVPLGEAGEICVRPTEPGIMYAGYFRDAQRTVEAWRNLWHHTGDMARRDAAGVYYFADRKKDYIRYKGRSISMFEVEEVIGRHDAVSDCAAFGVQSAELESESELAVHVVLKPGATLGAEELARFVNAHAPYYFVPRYIEFTTSLPRNAHGRLLKNELRDRGLTAATWDGEKAGFKPVR